MSGFKNKLQQQASSNENTTKYAIMQYFQPKYGKSWRLLGMLLPFTILVIIFCYAPLFGWVYAFFDYKPGLHLDQMNFVGLKYFKVIFGGRSEFYKVLGNTLAISSLGLLTSVIPVIFAILVSQIRSKKYSKFIQTAASIPNFISWVLVYAIIFSLFSGEGSIVNRFLMSLGIINEPLDILGDEKNAWYIQTFIGIWKGTGWGAIVYLAAMAGIDQELYDAASVDGANRFRKIIHITLPGIIPTYFVLLLLSISSILSNGFDQYWVFQNALTRDKLEVFDTYVYRLGMVNMQYSFSTAMGIFKSIISIILLTSANGLSKKIRGESII